MPWGYVGAELAQLKVQLCGTFSVLADGRRVEGGLPGRQGRLLFGYLALNRLRQIERSELVAALWPDGRDGGLAPLLSKLRRVIPLNGLRLADAWIDVEAAGDGRAQELCSIRDILGRLAEEPAVMERVRKRAKALLAHADQ